MEHAKMSVENDRKDDAKERPEQSFPALGAMPAEVKPLTVRKLTVLICYCLVELRDY